MIKKSSDVEQISLKQTAGEAVEYPVRKQVGLEPTDALAEAGRKVISFHFARMLRHEPGTCLGEDIEELHDMRVATRRMRAAFDVFSQGFSKETVKPLLKGLRATGRALGGVRDLDVFMEKLAPYHQSLPQSEQSGLQPLLHAWSTKREQAREKMLAHLDSKDYLQFKQDLFEFIKTRGMGAKLIPDDKPVPFQLNHVAPRMVYSQYAAMKAFDRLLDNAPLETLHQLRIAAKGFRYTVEYFREILGQERDLVIKEMKAMQDHLGDLNDADVASNFVRNFLVDWETGQVGRPSTELQSPTLIEAYLNAKLDERSQLIATFPQAWTHFNCPDFRQNLALAIAAL